MTSGSRLSLFFVKLIDLVANYERHIAMKLVAKEEELILKHFELVFPGVTAVMLPFKSNELFYFGDRKI